MDDGSAETPVKEGADRDLMEGYLSLKEAAAVIGWSEPWLKSLATANRIAHVETRWGIFISKEEVAALKERRAAGKPAPKYRVRPPEPVTLFLVGSGQDNEHPMLHCIHLTAASANACSARRNKADGYRHTFYMDSVLAHEAEA